MRNHQCLYVKGIFIGIIYVLKYKLNPCFIWNTKIRQDKVHQAFEKIVS